MSYTFLNICRNVLNIPDLDMDVSSFKMQNCTLDMKKEDGQFYNAFLNPLLYSLCMFINKDTCDNKMYKCISEKIKKFDYLYTHSNSWFAPISQHSISEHTHSVNKFYECQRHYHALIKLSQKIRHRYAKVKNTTDLLLMPINENDRGTYPYVENGVKYIFRVAELRQIIVTCIANTESFFPEKLEIKNPYSNIILSDSVLYNFYFFMKTHNYSIPDLVHGYFLCGFDYDKYLSKYEILIRDYAIEQRIMRGNVDKLYPVVFRMLIQYRDIISNVKISYGFPKKELVDIMRPYLLLYYYHLYYAQDFPRRYESEEELRDRLKYFSRFNPYFGQRTTTKTNPFDVKCDKITVSYNSAHPNFYKDNYKDTTPVCVKQTIDIDLENDFLFNKITQLKRRGIWNDQYTDEDSDEDHVTNYYIRYNRPNISRPITGRRNRDSSSRSPLRRSTQQDSDDEEEIEQPSNTIREMIRRETQRNLHSGISTLYDTGDEDDEEGEVPLPPPTPQRQTVYSRGRSPSYDSTDNIINIIDSSGNLLNHDTNNTISEETGEPQIDPPPYQRVIDSSGNIQRNIVLNPNLLPHNIRQDYFGITNNIINNSEHNHTSSLLLPEVVESMRLELQRLSRDVENEVRNANIDVSLNTTPTPTPSHSRRRRVVRARFRNRDSNNNEVNTSDAHNYIPNLDPHSPSEQLTQEAPSTPILLEDDEEEEGVNLLMPLSYPDLPLSTPEVSDDEEEEEEDSVKIDSQDILETQELDNTLETDTPDTVDYSMDMDTETSESTNSSCDSVESALPYDPNNYSSQQTQERECSSSSDEKEEAISADNRDADAAWIKEQEEIDEWYFGREDREGYRDNTLTISSEPRDENVNAVNEQQDKKMITDSVDSDTKPGFSIRGIDGQVREVTVTPFMPTVTNSNPFRPVPMGIRNLPINIQNNAEFMRRFDERLRQQYLSMGMAEENWQEVKEELRNRESAGWFGLGDEGDY